MIFKTTDDGGLTNIFKELKSIQVTFEELDKTTLRSAIKSFNNTSISIEDLSEKFGGLDNSVMEYLNNTERGQASIDGLSKSIDNSATSMISATAKAKILAIALNALTGLAISLAFKGITWAIDELIVTLDEQKEKLDEAVTAYEESKSELEKINNELKTTSERIDELNEKENLTFTEQDELEKLIKTNDELERKIYLLEQANKEAEKEIATEAQNTYDKYTNNRTLGALEQIEFYSDSSLLEGVNWDNFKGDLSWLVAQYRNQEEILAKAQANGLETIEKQAKTNLALLEGYMSEASLDYQDLYDKINGISDYAMTDDLKVAKQDLDDILDIVAEILGYGGQRSEITFDDIWNSEDFSQYKKELESVAKEGKLDASVLESNENYKKLLEDTGATAESTAEHINALVAEMEQDDSQNSNKSADLLGISETITELNKLKPTMDALGEAYTNIFTSDGFTKENIGLDMFSSIKDELDELAEAGIFVDTSSFENLISVLSNTESKATDIQNAFNSLAGSIVNAGVSGLEEFNTLKSTLSNFGVQNSDIIAFQELIQSKEALVEAGLNLESATKKEIVAFAAEYVSAENLGKAVNLLQMQKILCNENWLNSTNDIKSMYALASAAGIATEALGELLNFQNIYNNAKTTTAKVAAQHKINDLKKQIDAQFASLGDFEVEIDFSVPDASKASKSTQKEVDIMAELNSEMDEYQSKLEAVKSARETYNEYGKITVDQAQDIIDADFRLLEAYGSEEEALERLGKAKLNEMQIQLARNALDTINSITSEAMAADYLAGANENLAKSYESVTEAMLKNAAAEAERRT